MVQAEIQQPKKARIGLQELLNPQKLNIQTQHSIQRKQLAMPECSSPEPQFPDFISPPQTTIQILPDQSEINRQDTNKNEHVNSPLFTSNFSSNDSLDDLITQYAAAEKLKFAEQFQMTQDLETQNRQQFVNKSSIRLSLASTTTDKNFRLADNKMRDNNLLMTEEINNLRHTRNNKLQGYQQASNLLNTTTLSIPTTPLIESRSQKVFKQLAGGSKDIDFTFNTIKSVKKVHWKQQAPWYREVTDGFCWIAYCHNQELSESELHEAKGRARNPPYLRKGQVYAPKKQSGCQRLNFDQNFKKFKCPAYKDMVIINRGYTQLINFQKDLDANKITCPVCLGQKNLKIKNMGFVNSEWNMRGILRSNPDSRIYADGKTYDGKLYTFKESDFKDVWLQLDVKAQKLPEMRKAETETVIESEIGKDDQDNQNESEGKLVQQIQMTPVKKMLAGQIDKEKVLTEGKINPKTRQRTQSNGKASDKKSNYTKSTYSRFSKKSVAKINKEETINCQMF